MIKELSIAIVLGAIIGFGVTSGIVSLKNKNSQSQVSPTPLTTPSPSEPQTNLHSLSIQNPNNETVTNQDKVDITGSTTNNSQVVIHSQNDTFFIIADDNGQFKQTIELEGGANLIQISSISPNEQQADYDLIITYSTVDF